MQDGVGDGWLVALTALVTALGAAGLAIYNAWHKAHQERDMTAVANLQAIVDRQEAQIARLCRHQREQQAVIARLQELEVECREVAAEQRGWMILLHDTARRFHTALAGQTLRPIRCPICPRRDPGRGTRQLRISWFAPRRKTPGSFRSWTQVAPVPIASLGRSPYPLRYHHCLPKKEEKYESADCRGQRQHPGDVENAPGAAGLCGGQCGHWQVGQNHASLPPPDVVVLDLLLPGVSGADLLAEMRRCPGWERVPAILETAASEEDLAALDLVHLAPVGILRKPYDPEQMLALLAQIEGGSRP
jgi:CheY-like chemotaxis protein